MEEKRKQEIIGVVQDILTKNGSEESVIDVVGLVNSLGFSVYNLTDEAKFDGVIAVNKSNEPISPYIKDSRIIGFKKDLERSQNRFIMAHELGHFYLHSEKTKNPLFIYKYHDKGAKYDDDLENEADFFAANLLVPERDLRNFLSNYKETKDNIFAIEEASSHFQVSVDCIKKRLAEIGYVA